MATVLTRLDAYGYRCFPVFSLDLGSYHALAGANGAGKTTLLDIPTLLGAARPSDVFLRTQGSHPLAGTVSARGCQDEAHQLLRNTLCTWFPEVPQ